MLKLENFIGHNVAADCEIYGESWEAPLELSVLGIPVRFTREEVEPTAPMLALVACALEKVAPGEFSPEEVASQFSVTVGGRHKSLEVNLPVRVEVGAHTDTRATPPIIGRESPVVEFYSELLEARGLELDNGAATLGRDGKIKFGGTTTAGASVVFNRTLRIPDDNCEYPLPPGLGHFPLVPVAACGDKAPEAWRRRGGLSCRCALPRRAGFR